MQPQLNMNKEKLEKMAAQVRTGGKGSVRRKKKAVHKTTTTDDKRLQNTLKRLGVNNIPAIEEVNLFKDNGTVIHFNNPKGLLVLVSEMSLSGKQLDIVQPSCEPSFFQQTECSHVSPRSASFHRC